MQPKHLIVPVPGKGECRVSPGSMIHVEEIEAPCTVTQLLSERSLQVAYHKLIGNNRYTTIYEWIKPSMITDVITPESETDGATGT